MDVKKSIGLIAKIIGLTIAMFILTAVGAGILGPQVPGAEEVDPGAALTGLLLVSFIDTLVLSAFILRSRLSGWKLVGISILLYYGVKTFMTQIETWYFIEGMTGAINSEMLPSLFLMGIPPALLFPPIAVWLLGKFKADDDASVSDRVKMPTAQFLIKVGLIAAIVYPILYFTFGYFIAWKTPELAAFYGGSDPGNFWLQMQAVLGADPLLYPFQILRGLMWIGLAIPVIKLTKGEIWVAALLVALFFSVVMNDVQFIPNPLMPPAVQRGHFLETASSNFILGLIIVFTMHRSHGSSQK